MVDNKEKKGGKRKITVENNKNHPENIKRIVVDAQLHGNCSSSNTPLENFYKRPLEKPSTESLTNEIPNAVRKRGRPIGRKPLMPLNESDITKRRPGRPTKNSAPPSNKESKGPSFTSPMPMIAPRISQLACPPLNKFYRSTASINGLLATPPPTKTPFVQFATHITTTQPYSYPVTSNSPLIKTNVSAVFTNKTSRFNINTPIHFTSTKMSNGHTTKL